jgi:4-amino-4-deoxy-L-arabinose transferase-like glycosyltransferase
MRYTYTLPPSNQSPDCYTGARLRAITLLTCIALLVRIAVFFFSIELPGDGPTRALQNYKWANSPDFTALNVWLPGYYYLAGSFNMIFGNDPLISSRLMNVVIGTLTVPAIYLFSINFFTWKVAFLSATLLAFFPIHITLSTTSLTETSCALWLIISCIFFLHSLQAESRKSRLYLSLFVLSYWMAAATRYEAWIFLPIFISLTFLRYRNIRLTMSILTLLSIVPVTWMGLKTLEFGNPFAGPLAAVKGAEAEGIFSLTYPIPTIKIVLVKLFGLIGPVTLLGITVSMLHWLRNPFSLTTSISRLLLLGFNTVFWLTMLIFTVARGSSLYDRYLLLGVVLMLPVASWGLLRILGSRSSAIWAAGVLLISSFAIGGYVASPQLYIIDRSHSDAAQKVAEFIRERHGNVPVIMTEMDWESTYIPLYYPSIADKYAIISYFITDSQLREYLRLNRPTLLITKDGDDEHRARLEEILATPFSEKTPVLTISSTFYWNSHINPKIRVYNIERLYSPTISE